MLPVIASVNTFNYQTPLVNTTMPGTASARVPYDTVAPSVSDAQVDNNNTSGNNSVTSSAAGEQAQAPSSTAAPAEDSNGNFASLLQSSTSSSSNSGPQSAFVAQLAAQDGSPVTQVILVQYEKLIANSNVKYAPSEAQKPTEEPSSTFGRILQSEQSQQPQQVQQAAPKQEPAPVAPNTQQPSVQTAPAPIVQTQAAVYSGQSPSSRNSSSASSGDGNSNESDGDSSTDSLPSYAMDAYISTASRINSFSNSPTELA